MNKFRLTINALAVAICMIAFASFAQAQATRTWVSGVGDDANPCSRTAPCKTWAGAISKTATDGEIDALDPGGFGSVTITKSITLDGNGWGSILAAGVNGINVNFSPGTPGATNSVQIRRMSINGAGTGTNGISITGTGTETVYVEDCLIFGFRGAGGHGIANTRTAGGNLFVLRTLIKYNAGDGARILPSSGTTTLQAVFDSCQFIGNQIGVLADTGSQVTVVNSTASYNTGGGFFVEGSGANGNLNLQRSISSHNGQGVFASTGGVVRISEMQITNNVNGLHLAGGTVSSYGNNNIAANNSENGPPNGTPITQQ